MFSVKVCAPAVLAAGLITTAATAQIGAGPGATPNATRSVPAETTAALYKDPKWRAPRTSWGVPSLDGQWSVDDMRGIPGARPQSFGTRESLNAEEFKQRASQQQGGDDRARQTETFLRTEWGTRTFGFASLLVDPPDGRMPDLTPAAQAKAASARRVGTFADIPYNSFEDFSLYDRCITRGIFGGVMPSIYGNGIRIVQSPEQISITYEMIHDTRIIDLGDKPSLDGDIRQYMGNSRGRWEGDTLVVDATNFTDIVGVGGRATPSKSLKITERYRRVDPEMIEYRVTVNDPETFTAPFTYRVMFTTQPNYEVYEYSCHEGNSAVGGGLAGERAYEKQVAEAKAKGLPVPPRSPSNAVYRAPEEGAEVFNINRGE